ncbi:zinc transport system substrate-binding protein [Prosthecobacter fusiformis]|uniref:Zinc transport system substrate-binding protein n=1 Tax=Prosthecobacter fusiformis TaxID=48464 RepID=A0A4R7S125_9BACT|nr:metal ABC transporter substrate-binding protein [Prosthecobacter fusiformis]TDU71166.1 zinc transport system substrate-binding protein [Prosthecobacter fusiformis]
MHFTLKPILALPLFVLLSGCLPSDKSTAVSAEEKGKPQIYVANYPLKYFAQRLGGSAVDVHFPAPADEDPAFWSPDDDSIASYQAADLILMNGASYSKWVDNTTLPDDKVVNTSSAFSKDFIEIKDATTHSHGPGGEHSHSGTAFTTWMDFQQAILQAKEVSTALEGLVPAEEKEGVKKHFEELKKELESLDQRLLDVGKKIARAPLVASHPVYHYMARRYDLNLEAVLWEPETVPDEKAMTELQNVLSKHPAQWMIWEGEPTAQSVEKLAAIGLKSVVVDPCGNVPENGDFISVMKTNIEALEKAFP